MSKVKILTISVLVLVILNLGMIAFCRIIKQKEFGGRDGGPKQMIIEKLHFNDQQKEALNALVVVHKSNIDAIEQDIRGAKENLFAQLLEPQVNQKVKDSLVRVLGDSQIKIEKEHFDHFQKIHSICNTPEQKEDFRALVKELGKIFSKRRMQNKAANKVAN
ncbi:Spy/CpxP family protein refolding chaperone [Flavobacterium algicola]|uniref:Spy/CpxP family protein refolding chaperone n=1 Tax=Flavobacterium algicola TaxID=556529 RepID=UPI001EFC402F|nr:hypothetical protein [Flavobacterium algicola]MCG9791250.1 hypothetical protein [Flavobacterium algicola]